MLVRFKCQIILHSEYGTGYRSLLEGGWVAHTPYYRPCCILQVVLVHMQEVLQDEEVQLLHCRLPASSTSLNVANLLSSLTIPHDMPPAEHEDSCFSSMATLVRLYQIVNFHFLTSDNEFLFMFLLTVVFILRIFFLRNFKNCLFVFFAHTCLGSFVS